MPFTDIVPIVLDTATETQKFNLVANLKSKTVVEQARCVLAFCEKIYSLAEADSRCAGKQLLFLGWENLISDLNTGFISQQDEQHIRAMFADFVKQKSSTGKNKVAVMFGTSYSKSTILTEEQKGKYTRALEATTQTFPVSPTIADQRKILNACAVGDSVEVRRNGANFYGVDAQSVKPHKSPKTDKAPKPDLGFWTTTRKTIPWFGNGPMCDYNGTEKVVFLPGEKTKIIFCGGVPIAVQICADVNQFVLKKNLPDFQGVQIFISNSVPICDNRSVLGIAIAPLNILVDVFCQCRLIFNDISHEIKASDLPMAFRAILPENPDHPDSVRIEPCQWESESGLIKNIYLENSPIDLTPAIKQLSSLPLEVKQKIMTLFREYINVMPFVFEYVIKTQTPLSEFIGLYTFSIIHKIYLHDTQLRNNKAEKVMMEFNALLLDSKNKLLKLLKTTDQLRLVFDIAATTNMPLREFTNLSSEFEEKFISMFTDDQLLVTTVCDFVVSKNISLQEILSLKNIQMVINIGFQIPNITIEQLRALDNNETLRTQTELVMRGESKGQFLKLLAVAPSILTQLATSTDRAISFSFTRIDFLLSIAESAQKKPTQTEQPQQIQVQIKSSQTECQRDPLLDKTEHDDCASWQKSCCSIL